MIGYGSGDGYGSGYGDGYGYGYGYGDGDGSGDGSGYGYGDGYGDGDGSGYGSRIGTIDEKDVMLLVPWPLVRVGCQLHAVSHWKNNWRQIAESEGVIVLDSVAAELFEKFESMLK